MLSISRHIDEHDIAQEVRLERMTFKGAFLIIEGQTDISRFGKYIDDAECSIVNSHGKRNALRAMDILNGANVPGVACVLDADFDRINKCLLAKRNVMYSKFHDFDLDWATAEIIEYYLTQVGDEGKISILGGASAIFDKLIDSLRLLSIARYLNSTRKIPYKLSEIDFSPCWSNFHFDLDQYLSILAGTHKIRPNVIQSLKSIILAEAIKPHNKFQLTNGHDFHCALGLSLRNEIGARKSPQTWGTEIAMHLRLAFDDDQFSKVYIFGKIRAWEAANSPYKIIHERFAA